MPNLFAFLTGLFLSLLIKLILWPCSMVLWAAEGVKAYPRLNTAVENCMSDYSLLRSSHSFGLA